MIAGGKAGWCLACAACSCRWEREVGVVRRTKCECRQAGTGVACLRAHGGPQSLGNHAFQTWVLLRVGRWGCLKDSGGSK